MTARIFFAMRLQPLHLEEVQLYRRLASEQAPQDPYFALLCVNLVDGAYEVDEGAVDDAYALAQLEADLDAGLLGAHLAEDAAHLGLFQRRRCGAGTHETGHSRCVADHGPGIAGAGFLLGRRAKVFLAHLDHLHKHVAREYLARNGAAKSVADLYLIDGGDDYVEDEVLRIHGPDTVLQIGAGLVLVAGVGVNDVPGAARLEHLVVRDGRVFLRPLLRFRLDFCRLLRGNLSFRGLGALPLSSQLHHVGSRRRFRG